MNTSNDATMGNPVRPTAVIVDDESHARENLLGLLGERHPEVDVIATASDVPTGIKLIRSTVPALLFLDVEMGSMTGFDLLKAIAPMQPRVIFTTAHEGYAVRAIRFNAIDYLLKPIVPEELDDAVNRVLQQLRQGTPGGDVPALLGSMEDERQLALPLGNGLAVVRLEDILYCNSDDNYTEVHVHGERKPFVVCKPLASFDAFLKPRGFVRIHQSHLINRRHIRRYIRGEGGEVVMSDGTNLPVSRRQKAELLEALERF